MSDATEATSPATSTTEPIPALLPHDWPRQLEEFLDAVHATPAARVAAFAFVDGWVLAAVPTDDAVTT